jgi:hypothetical protein
MQYWWEFSDTEDWWMFATCFRIQRKRAVVSMMTEAARVFEKSTSLRCACQKVTKSMLQVSNTLSITFTQTCRDEQPYQKKNRASVVTLKSWARDQRNWVESSFLPANSKEMANAVKWHLAIQMKRKTKCGLSEPEVRVQNAETQATEGWMLHEHKEYWMRINTMPCY